MKQYKFWIRTAELYRIYFRSLNSLLSSIMSDDEGDDGGWDVGEGRPNGEGMLEPGCAKAILIQLVIITIPTTMIIDIKMMPIRSMIIYTSILFVL